MRHYTSVEEWERGRRAVNYTDEEIDALRPIVRRFFDRRSLEDDYDFFLAAIGRRRITSRYKRPALRGFERARKFQLEHALPHMGQALRASDSIDRPRTPVFSFTIQGYDPAEAGTRLDVDYSIACRTGYHFAPLVHEDIGSAPHGAIRFSLGPFTKRADVDAAVAAVKELARERR
jgi:selenocysteine lyase/cysteine desulfurase